MMRKHMSDHEDTISFLTLELLSVMPSLAALFPIAPRGYSGSKKMVMLIRIRRSCAYEA